MISVFVGGVLRFVKAAQLLVELANTGYTPPPPPLVVVVALYLYQLIMFMLDSFSTVLHLCPSVHCPGNI